MRLFSVEAPNFDLGHTLECGQVFRWDKVGLNEYEGVVTNSIVRIKQKKEGLFVSASGHEITPSFIKSYFDLTLDLPRVYNKITYNIGEDKLIKAAIRRFRGLRIIKQPLWECLASFIISANNNIPRIRKIIDRLCRCFGKRLLFNGVIRHSFPDAELFANSTVSRLEACGTGYRADYLKKSARTFLEKGPDAGLLKKMPYAEAKKYLMENFDGVGDKVADCALLFSVGRFEAFPVDVWIKRKMEELYFNRRERTGNQIRQFAAAHFGEYAGYAQQYLYHYARSLASG